MVDVAQRKLLEEVRAFVEDAPVLAERVGAGRLARWSSLRLVHRIGVDHRPPAMVFVSRYCSNPSMPF